MAFLYHTTSILSYGVGGVGVKVPEGKSYVTKGIGKPISKLVTCPCAVLVHIGTLGKLTLNPIVVPVALVFANATLLCITELDVTLRSYPMQLLVPND